MGAVALPRHQHGRVVCCLAAGSAERAAVECDLYAVALVATYRLRPWPCNLEAAAGHSWLSAESAFQVVKRGTGRACVPVIASAGRACESPDSDPYPRPRRPRTARREASDVTVVARRTAGAGRQFGSLKDKPADRVGDAEDGERAVLASGHDAAGRRIPRRCVPAATKAASRERRQQDETERELHASETAGVAGWFSCSRVHRMAASLADLELAVWHLGYGDAARFWMRSRIVECLKRLIACGVLTLVAGCGSAGGSRSPSAVAAKVPAVRPVVADASLRLPLPPGWHGRVIYGGLGADPVGLPVLMAANFRLPQSAAECERLLPGLSPGRVVVRIYDYGSSLLAPPMRPARVIRPGSVLAGDNVPGFAQSRTRFARHSLVVRISYGARRPPAQTLRAVRRYLAGASTMTN